MSQTPQDLAVSSWDNQGIPIRDNTNLEKLLEILVYEYAKITVADDPNIGYGEDYGLSYGVGESNSELQDVYESSKIGTAVDKSLNKLGELVNVPRRTNESNTQYRARIRANFRASTANATFTDVLQFASSILDVSITQLELNARTIGDAPDIQLFVPADALDNLEITLLTFESLMEQVVAASHSISIVERGTFRVRTASDIDDASQGLISEGGSGGGTLASSP